MMVVCNAAHGYSVWLLKRKLSLGDTRCDAVVVPSAAANVGVAVSVCVICGCQRCSFTVIRVTLVPSRVTAALWFHCRLVASLTSFALRHDGPDQAN